MLFSAALVRGTRTYFQDALSCPEIGLHKKSVKWSNKTDLPGRLITARS